MRGSLLEFTLTPIGPRRRWQNVLNKQRYQARLQQSRDATPGHDLGHEVTQALRRALLRQIETDPTLTPHSTLHFTMQSGAFDHAFQSATFRVREVQEDSEQLSTYLQTLAQKLNSNQTFNPDDTFDLETTFIRTPGPGRGNGKRYKPASASSEGPSSPSRTEMPCAVPAPSSPCGPGPTNRHACFSRWGTRR